MEAPVGEVSETIGLDVVAGIPAATSEVAAGFRSGLLGQEDALEVGVARGVAALAAVGALVPVFARLGLVEAEGVAREAVVGAVLACSGNDLVAWGFEVVGCYGWYCCRCRRGGGGGKGGSGGIRSGGNGDGRRLRKLWILRVGDGVVFLGWWLPIRGWRDVLPVGLRSLQES